MKLAPFRLLPVVATLTLKVSSNYRLHPDTYTMSSSDMAVSAYAGIIIVVYCVPSSGSGTQCYDSRWLCDCSSFYKAFKGNDGAVFSNHTSIIPNSICSTIYYFHS